MNEDSDTPRGAHGKTELDELEGTLLLSAPPGGAEVVVPSAPADVEGTLLLAAPPGAVADATEADELEATLFMAQRERAVPDATLVLGIDVAEVPPMPVEATMLLPSAVTANDHANATLMATMAAPAPAAAYHSPTMTPQGHAPNQPASFPPASFPPLGGDPRAVAPQGSRLGPLVAILALIAAVAGVVVGLLLGDG